MAKRKAEEELLELCEYQKALIDSYEFIFSKGDLIKCIQCNITINDITMDEFDSDIHTCDECKTIQAYCGRTACPPPVPMVDLSPTSHHNGKSTYCASCVKALGISFE